MELNTQEIAEIIDLLNDLSGRTEQELKPFEKLIKLLSQKIDGANLNAESPKNDPPKTKKEVSSIADEIANFNKCF